MFWSSALLGIIVGWLRNGKIKHLGQISLIGWPLSILAIMTQVIIWIDFSTKSYFLKSYYPHLYVFSLLILLLFVYLQKRQAGMVILGLGLMLNLLVITTNQGMMPVDSTRMPAAVAEDLAAGGKSPFYTPMNDETWLNFLGDSISLPCFHNQLFSIGDLVIGLGILIFIQQNMQKKKKVKQWR